MDDFKNNITCVDDAIGAIVTYTSIRTKNEITDGPMFEAAKALCQDALDYLHYIEEKMNKLLEVDQAVI